MCRMIAELIDNMNVLNGATEGLRTEACFSHNPLNDQEIISVSSTLSVKEAYVSHGSTTVTPLISKLAIWCSQRTTLRFPYGVL
jgi:hypothetical protein